MLLPKDFKIYRRREQEVILVIHALSVLRGIRSKQDVLEFIREHRYLQIQPEDKHSYEGKNEWKADTLLCWARKDATLESLGWMFHHDEKDCWEITRDGIDSLKMIATKFENKNWEVHRCFMWTPAFKSLMDSRYRQSDRDWPRLRTRRERLSKLLDEL